MDVMKPGLEWIDGICYRLNTTAYDSNERGRESYEEVDSCPMERLDEYGFEDEEDIEEINNGRFRVNIHVAGMFLPRLVGTRGSTKKRMEAETQSHISIPRPGQAGYVVVTGLDRKSVGSARSRILAFVESARNKSSVTHFISVPCDLPSVQKEFLIFKEGVLNNCAARGVEEALFQTPEKLHLTICVLVLGDDVERQQAADQLERCKEDVIRPLVSEPFEIDIRGVDIMNDDPTAVKILYGKATCPSHPTLLQNMCNNVRNYFRDGGLAKNEAWGAANVKLHVTLMNTKFCSEDSWANKKMTFDGSQILEMYRDFHFGTFTISKLNLSVCGSYDASGHYNTTASIPIP